MVPQQVLLSFNAFFIILGVVGMAWLTRRMRTLSAMLIGMIMATVGVLVAGWTQSAWMLVAGILFFSLGEMMTGPKKSEYLALIAPPGKKGLYLGYVNIPVGVGVFLGSWIAGIGLWPLRREGGAGLALPGREDAPRRGQELERRRGNAGSTSA